VGRVHVTVTLYDEVVEDLLVSVGDGVWLGDHPKSQDCIPAPPLFVYTKNGAILAGGRRLYPGQTASVARGPVGMRLQCAPPRRRRSWNWSSFDLGFLLMLIGVSVAGMWVDMLDGMLDSGQGGDILGAFADLRSDLDSSHAGVNRGDAQRTAAVRPQAEEDTLPELLPGNWAGRRAQPDDHLTGWGWYGWYRDSVPVIAEALHAREKLVGQPDDQELRGHVGRAAYASEQYEEALFQFRWLVVQAPSDARWLEGMALAEKRLGMHNLELAAYKQVLATNPGHMGALGSSAVALARLGRLSAAWTALERLRTLYPTHASPLMYEAMVFAIEGRENYALAALGEGLAGYGSLSKSLRVEIRRDIALDPSFSRLRADERLVALVERLLGTTISSVPQIPAEDQEGELG
jgi:tetratricopeptide (TPR) repeat protein